MTLGEVMDIGAEIDPERPHPAEAEPVFPSPAWVEQRLLEAVDVFERLPGGVTRDCTFRRSRPAIPIDCDHPFRCIATTLRVGRTGGRDGRRRVLG